MNIPLRPDIEKFVASKVQSGQYESSQEVIEEALDQMRLQSQLTSEDVAELRRLLDIAIAQADRKEFVGYSAESVIRDARAALSKKQKAG